MIARHRTEIWTSQIIKALLNNFKNNKNSFKKELQKYFNVKKVLLMPSGRAAIYFVLKALSHKKVFMPAYTCWVVVEAAKLADKEIHFIDIDIASFNMNISELEQQIENDSIIIATHQFGIPCEINKIKNIAQRHNCFVLEDNAGGFGSQTLGKKTGAFGDVSIVSFEHTKTLTCGHGGAILFNNIDYFTPVKKLCDNELVTKFDFKNTFYLFIYNFITRPFLYRYITLPFLMRKYDFTTGKKTHNSNKDESYQIEFSNFKASLGIQELKVIDSTISKKRAIIDQYFNELKNIDGIELPDIDPDVFWTPIRFPIRITHVDKYVFYEKCKNSGVDLGFSFSYACIDEENETQFKNSITLANQVLNLPVYSKLSKRQVNKVISIIKKLGNKNIGK